MPIVPSVSAEHLTDQLAVPLARYAQLVDYSEAAFFGVRRDGQDEYACRTIWTRWQRQAVTRALMAAQGEFWKHCGYPMVKTFITAERHDYNRTVLLENCHVIGMGRKVDTLLASGKAVSHATDPVSISQNVTTTDPEEIHVYHPGTDYEIIPSSVVIAGGVATILIPRVRMVALANDNNPDDGWDYTDTSKFEQTVDIRWIYLDPFYQVEVFCQAPCACPPPVATTFWNSVQMKAPRIGHIKLDCNTSFCGCTPQYMEVSYLCGLESLSVHAEDAIIRLAHSRMPTEPCGCDFLRGMWERDKTVPDVLTAERENCPFGLSNAAWQSWEFMQDMVCYRGRAI